MGWLSVSVSASPDPQRATTMGDNDSDDIQEYNSGDEDYQVYYVVVRRLAKHSSPSSLDQHTQPHLVA